MISNTILFPLFLSLKVAGIATAASLVFGIVTARLLSRKHSPFHAFMDALCTLPMVLPPTVLGYYLILIFGRNGILGPGLQHLGITLMFSWHGAVIAATIVVFPLIYKSAKAALEQVDVNLENAARTLGLPEYIIFFKISLPLAFKGILAGAMLAFARGMGEFGATLMIAGNIPGKTGTISQRIAMVIQDGDYNVAGFWVLVIMILAFIFIVIMNLVTGRAMKNVRSW